MAGGVKMVFTPGGDSTKFAGTEGWVRIWRGGIDAQPKSLLKEKIGPKDEKLLNSRNHYQNFVDAIRSRKQPVSTLVDAVRSDNISQVCDIAVRLKRKITWDPAKQTIVGDEEAAQRMHRDMQAPWTI